MKDLIKNQKSHYVYKITNVITNEFYIGKRSCYGKIEDDTYMGSGKKLLKAIEKYGVNKFKKEIIKVLPTSDDAYDFESIFLTIDFVRRADTYNIATGRTSKKRKAKKDQQINYNLFGNHSSIEMKLFRYKTRKKYQLLRCEISKTRKKHQFLRYKKEHKQEFEYLERLDKKILELDKKILEIDKREHILNQRLKSLENKYGY